MRWTTRKLNFMLTNLQEYVLTVLEKKGESSIPDIENALKPYLDSASYVTIHTVLERFGEEYIKTRPREAVSRRGGRAGKLYSLTDAGRAMLKAKQESYAGLLESLSPHRPKPRSRNNPGPKVQAQLR